MLKHIAFINNKYTEDAPPIINKEVKSKVLESLENILQKI